MPTPLPAAAGVFPVLIGAVARLPQVIQSDPILQFGSRRPAPRDCHDAARTDRQPVVAVTTKVPGKPPAVDLVLAATGSWLAAPPFADFSGPDVQHPIIAAAGPRKSALR